MHFIILITKCLIVIATEYCNYSMTNLVSCDLSVVVVFRVSFIVETIQWAKNNANFRKFFSIQLIKGAS
jgi:hypothetical protein